MVSSTSAMLCLTDNLIELAERLGNTRAKRLVASAFFHGPPLHRSFDSQQGALDAIHGFFEWLTAHGS
jgi:hypothetical protein